MAATRQAEDRTRCSACTHCISSNSRSPPSEASAKPPSACRFHPRLPCASAEHTPALFTKRLRRLFTHTVPSEQISESVCLDLGIIAGASVSVQRRFCDPGRDMTLMFDEACCWWIWCSCRPLAGSPSPLFVVCSDVSAYSVIRSMTGICFC